MNINGYKKRSAQRNFLKRSTFMAEFTRAQLARQAIREFKTSTDALALRGHYRPSGKFGKALETCLRSLSPEIYGTMNDPRIVELKGLEYVIDRLPRGIEECTRIILTEEQPFEGASFEKIEPLKRRRTCYRISKNEICFVISRGQSEIYDILTHMTFLNAAANKIHRMMKDDQEEISIEWNELSKAVQTNGNMNADELNQAIWNLSIILGRSYRETRETYEYLENNRKEHNSNNSLFSLIHSLGNRINEEKQSFHNSLVIYLTPSLMDVIVHQKCEKEWADNIKNKLVELKLQKRPVHIISANLHSVVNMLYGHGAIIKSHPEIFGNDPYDSFFKMREHTEQINTYAAHRGFYEIADSSGTHIDCQLIDTALMDADGLHPLFSPDLISKKGPKPVILVMDYAFGAQAFDLMENLLKPHRMENKRIAFDIKSISIMGKAGILPGEKGDIMLATAHVFEGTSDNYLFKNDITKKEFDESVNVYTGPMVTVLGTSLQNRDVLKKFQADWKTIGLEMEGGHYQRAINAAVIKDNIKKDVKVRYAYYASDNPLETGATLAAGAMGMEGIRPTYMITKVILEKIMGK
jgi:hypothetical protein